MTARKRVTKDQIPSDPNITLASVLGDILTVLVHHTDRTPANPEATAAIGRLDAARQNLQRNLGQEPTEIKDRHGKPINSTANPEGE